MKGYKTRLFAWGQVTYDDVYEESHVTNFCIGYAFPKFKNAKGESDVRITSAFFSRHNSAT
jgi:hypothetical protein